MSIRNQAFSILQRAVSFTALVCAMGLPAPAHAQRAPKVVLVSLDGAKPDLITKYLNNGTLRWNGGLAQVANGVFARQNVTAQPSLTAVGHIAIATGSTAVHNDIPANSFHPVAGSISSGLSGFAAPIGGYQFAPLGPSPDPTAEPLWVRLRQAGKKVVAATWPGADGADIRVNGVVVQPAEPTRVTDFTVPFGSFGGIGAVGFNLTAGNFAPDTAVADAIAAAGRVSHSPVLATTAPVETFTCSSATTATCSTGSSLDLSFQIRVAALDTTDDSVVNYDTLVFFDQTRGILPGPFAPPATGPAYVQQGKRSGAFFFEGTGNKVGTAYYVTALAPDLSTVRFVRYGASYIPRNAPVLADVDDINTNVGFWRPQADFRIPERLSPGFTNFPDIELEAVYRDQVWTFVKYQTAVVERAIKRNPDADLIMAYIEQPDGSSHQFLLTDPRQASDPRDPNSIGANQDAAKVARYASHIRFAYKVADHALERIIRAAGPSSNVIVVSDHGFAPFHTAVNMTNLLRNAGVDTSKLSIRASGSAVNIYVNLQGRETGGTVDATTYKGLIGQIRNVLKYVTDPNTTFNYSLYAGRIFGTVETRPFVCAQGVGFCTSDKIGQDSGDVFAQLALGYNFDGIQNPGVARLGDAAFDPATTVFSTPNFYGAHGHNAELKAMSATFIAAGRNIRANMTVDRVNNIDVAPTIMQILGVQPGPDVDGRALSEILR